MSTLQFSLLHVDKRKTIDVCMRNFLHYTWRCIASIDFSLSGRVYVSSRKPHFYLNSHESLLTWHSHSVVVGAVQGHFIPVFDKLAKLHAKNGFSLAIILGDLFKDPADLGPEDEENISTLLRGDIAIPLLVYFTLGRHALPPKVFEKLESSANELCENLYFLGKRSTTKTIEGLKIVTLGGLLDSAITAGISKDRYLPFHTEDDAKALKGANNADILITTHWPTLIRSGSKVKLPEGVGTPQTEQCIADLCSALKPRYHFSTSDDAFYEREPFFHITEDGQPDPMAITRFLSLASFMNPSKQKWLYAFTIDPKVTATTTITPGTTASPFNLKKRERQAGSDEPYSRYSKGGDHYRPTKRSRAPRSQPTPQQCFFCLSNPNLATHLISSIGTETYLTISKGPLTTASTYPQLGFPGHILIIPFTHSPTFSTVPDQEVRSATYKEMQRYRRALHSMLIDKANSALGAITWEISRADGVHFHWQFLPVPADKIQSGLVEAAFKVQAENEKYPSLKVKDIGDGAAEKGDYFRLWTWYPQKDESNGADAANGGHSSEDELGETRGKEKSYVMSLPVDMRFDLQFGRRVMAKLLGLELRAHWKDCPQTEVSHFATFWAPFGLFREY